MKVLDADVLSKLAFHECMHNKLQLGDGMHAQGGLAAATVGSKDMLSADNVGRMARALHDNVPQWIGGINLMLSARQRRDQGDPFWYQ